MPKDRIELQNAEFTALDDLIQQWNRLRLTPVVDDDYPEMRHYYESSLRSFVRALNENRGSHETLKVDFPTSGAASVPAYGVMWHISARNYQRALRWHRNLDSWSLSDWYTALAGECGELGNVIKKLNRIRDGLPAKQRTKRELESDMRMEIGDTYIYLDLLAQRAGFSIADCVRDTFNRISEREDFPERL